MRGVWCRARRATAGGAIVGTLGALLSAGGCAAPAPLVPAPVTFHPHDHGGSEYRGGDVMMFAAGLAQWTPARAGVVDGGGQGALEVWLHPRHSLALDTGGQRSSDPQGVATFAGRLGYRARFESGVSSVRHTQRGGALGFGVSLNHLRYLDPGAEVGRRDGVVPNTRGYGVTVDVEGARGVRWNWFELTGSLRLAYSQNEVAPHTGWIGSSATFMFHVTPRCRRVCFALTVSPYSGVGGIYPQRRPGLPDAFADNRAFTGYLGGMFGAHLVTLRREGYNR